MVLLRSKIATGYHSELHIKHLSQHPDNIKIQHIGKMYFLGCDDVSILSRIFNYRVQPLTATLYRELIELCSPDRYLVKGFNPP